MILLPPKIVSVEGPVIFLAGPIQGAADWQARAISLIPKLHSGVHIASPRRQIETYGKDFGQRDFNEQVDWETYYLNRSATNGAILFWLAREFDHYCSRAYAQTTRAELFEWKIRHQMEGSKLVVGIDRGFTGARYIRRRFAQDCPDMQIMESLKTTCQAAITLV